MTAATGSGQVPARPRVLLLPPDPPAELVEAAYGGLAEVEVVRLPEQSPAALHELLPTADVVVGDWSGQLALTGTEAVLARRARLVQQPISGVDTIDLAAFRERGVPVANTGSTNAASVAEWALGAVLCLLRSYRWADRQVRRGEWPNLAILDHAPPRELRHLRIGLVGAGAVGQACARLYAAVGCEVSYWSPRSRLDPDLASYRELPDLFATSDVVLVTVARTPETLGLVGVDLLGSLPEGALVVDVSRGGIVRHDVLLELLDTGHLAGVAIDVFETEPPELPARWRHHPDVLLSPHVAGVTADSMARTYRIVRDNIRAALTGGDIAHVVP